MIHVGDWVLHPSFGRGRVIAVDGAELYVRFDGGNESRVMARDCVKSKRQ